LPNPAQEFPSLSFVVQDISNHMLSQARGTANQDLEGRVTFQQHDFFTPQPVHDANAFLLRQCLHNYNDRDCVKILRGLVPALERCHPGTPLLANEIILPESGTMTRFEERHLRQLDLTMLVGFGSKQRTERDFNTLCKEADPRFEVSFPPLYTHIHTSCIVSTTAYCKPFPSIAACQHKDKCAGSGSA
jgi:hypothetical protein